MLLLPSALLANFPKNCRPLMTVSESFTLQADKADSLFYIHNESDEKMFVVALNNTGTAAAGWTSSLDKKKWSVLLLNSKRLTFNCVLSRPGSEYRVPCSSVVKVCEMKGVSGKKANTSYWAVENIAFDFIQEKLAYRGIATKP